MTRRARKPADQQEALPLPCDPAGQDALRTAWSESGLREQGYSFERALQIPAIRIGLNNVARAVVSAKRPA